MSSRRTSGARRSGNSYNDQDAVRGSPASYSSRASDMYAGRRTQKSIVIEPEISDLQAALEEPEHPIRKACAQARIGESQYSPQEPTALIEALQNASVKDLLHYGIVKELFKKASEIEAGSKEAKAFADVTGGLKYAADVKNLVRVREAQVDSWQCPEADLHHVCRPGNIVHVDLVDHLLDPSILVGVDEFVSLPSGPGHHKRYPFCVLWRDRQDLYGVVLTSKQHRGITSVSDSESANYCLVFTKDGSCKIDARAQPPLFVQNMKPCNGSMACLTVRKVNLKHPIYKNKDSARLTPESVVRLADIVSKNDFVKKSLANVLKQEGYTTASNASNVNHNHTCENEQLNSAVQSGADQDEHNMKKVDLQNETHKHHEHEAFTPPNARQIHYHADRHSSPSHSTEVLSNHVPQHGRSNSSVPASFHSLQALHANRNDAASAGYHSAYQDPRHFQPQHPDRGDTRAHDSPREATRARLPEDNETDWTTETRRARLKEAVGSASDSRMAHSNKRPAASGQDQSPRKKPTRNQLHNHQDKYGWRNAPK